MQNTGGPMPNIFLVLGSVVFLTRLVFLTRGSWSKVFFSYFFTVPSPTPTELSLGFWKQELRTRIWQKVGVPMEKVGVPLQKSWSPTNWCIPYIFSILARSDTFEYFFRLTDFNPLRINGLFLLNKTKYIGICFHATWTHIFLFGLIKIKELLVLVLFITRQTDIQVCRQTDSSPLVCIILCRWKSFFLLKNASR